MIRQSLLAGIFAVLASHATAGPLHDAVKEGDVAQVRSLISSGEDVNQNDRSLGTPLHRAAISGNAEIVQLLIAEGADVNAENRGMGTPLHAAARKGSEAIAALLLANGAAADARNRNGKTALQLAAEEGHASLVELLIARGADVNARSGSADFPVVHFAGLNGHFDIIELLRAHGAKGPEIKPVFDLLHIASAESGEKIFDDTCGICHGIEKNGLGGRRGPNLWGVLGRKKASLENFAYSPAFTRLVGTWTLAELNAFIASSVDYTPGNQMALEGMITSVPNREQRADLIAFLRLQSGDPLPLPSSR
jgi:cytochrome c